MPPVIRIFFSSPGDVHMERETARRVVERLQSELGERATIEPYFWEHEVMVATKDYQENIPPMDDFDIVVCMLWSRLGTPLDPARHPRPDGGGFESGTEYEFFTAMKAHEEKGAPDIFVFRNTTEPRRPSRPREARLAVDREIDRLDHFFDRYFQDDRYFTRAINIYSTLGEFEEKLGLALRSYLEGRFPREERTQRRGPLVIEKPPYLGLAAFDFDDAPFFFGRTAQIGDVITALQNQEADAAANPQQSVPRFVLIMGASGSGKSSLARAGVLPMLVQRGVIDGAHAWRRAIFKPGDHGGDPLLALVHALAAPDALPELVADGGGPSELATLLREEPAGAGLLLRQALTQASAQALILEQQRLRTRLAEFEKQHREEDAREIAARIDALAPPAVRLALLADQLEELFTGDIPPADVERFFDILDKLARTGRVFVLATLRGDFYQHCLSHPKLVALMQGAGTYPLPPPSAADLARMIRQPAAATGLRFEENPATGEKLDDLIRDAAMRDPAALPLLSYTLEQLFDQRSPDGTLTLAAYRELGGLEGAIGSRAEAFYQNLSGAARGAFDAVWRKLVTICDEGEPTRRRAPYESVARSPAQSQLVDALVANRLLMADRAADGTRTVSVAHEALLRHWPRLVEWVRENRDFLRTRGRVALRLAEWVAHGETADYLIPRGPELAAAEVMLTRHPDALDAAETTYIAHSVDAVRRRDQRRLRNARLITAGAVVLCLIATVTGILALRESRNAKQQRAAAIEGERRAEEAANAAMRGDTRSSLLLGISALDREDTIEGLIHLARAHANDPGFQPAIDALASEFLYGAPKPILRHHERGLLDTGRQRISTNMTGTRQVAAWVGANGAPVVMDLNTEKPIDGPWTSLSQSLGCIVIPGGGFLLDVGEDKTITTWNIDTGTAGGRLTDIPPISNILVSNDGAVLITGWADGTLELHHTRDNSIFTSWKHEKPFTEVLNVMDRYIVAASGDLLVIFDREQDRITPRIHPETATGVEDPKASAEFTRVRFAIEKPLILVQTRTTHEGPDGPMWTDQLEWIDVTTGEPAAGKRTLASRFPIVDFQAAADGSACVLAPFGRAIEFRHAEDSDSDRQLPFAGQAIKVAITHDARFVAAGDNEGNIRVYDTYEGRSLFHPIRLGGAMEDLYFSWNGSLLLASTVDTASVWDIAVGPALPMPLILGKPPVNAHIDPGTLRLIEPEAIRIIDVESLAPAVDPIARPADVIAWQSDNAVRRVVGLLGDSRIRFYEIRDHQLVAMEETTIEAGFSYYQFSACGRFFLCVSPGAIRVVQVDGAREIAAIPHDPGRTSKWLAATAGEDPMVIVHDKPQSEDGQLSQQFGPLSVFRIAEGTPVIFSDGSILEQVNSFRTSECGRWLAINPFNSTGMIQRHEIALLNLHAPDEPARVVSHSTFIQDFAISPCGRHLAISGIDSVIQVWDIASARPAARPIRNPHGQAAVISFTPCGENLVANVMSNEQEDLGVIRTWYWPEATPVIRPFLLSPRADLVRASPDGRHLFCLRGTRDDTPSLGYFIEISPGPEISPQLAMLTEAITAMHCAPASPPVPTDPYQGWKRLAEAFPESWFLKPPATRSVSPAFRPTGIDWIRAEYVSFAEALHAMPAVALANAAAAHWQQATLNIHLREQGGGDGGTNRVQERIDQCVRFAMRHTHTDGLVCLHLARHAVEEDDYELAEKLARMGWELMPDSPEILRLLVGLTEDEDPGFARKLIERLVELEPDVPLHRMNLAHVMWDSGEKDAAREYYRALLDHHEVDEASSYLILLRAGRAGDALELVRERSRDATASENEVMGMLTMEIAAAHHAGLTEDAVSAYHRLIAMTDMAADPAVVEEIDMDPMIKEGMLNTLRTILAGNQPE